MIDRIRNRAFSHLPPRLPLDLANGLVHHGNPLAWWQGQLLTYLLRFNAKSQTNVNINVKKLNFKTPCVRFVFIYFIDFLDMVNAN